MTPCNESDIATFELGATMAAILALSGLDRARLDDAAMELQIDLELWQGGPEQTSTTQQFFDPHHHFLGFAAALSFEDSMSEGSGHVGLTHSQMYFVCAWNYAEISRWFTDTPISNDGFTREENIRLARLYGQAAIKLIQCARDSPFSCYPCGSPQPLRTVYRN